MKTNQVPQDRSSLTKKDLKELCYAVDENGNYTTALSTGWEPKTIALDESMQLIEKRVEEARIKVQQGRVSPIEYYMERSKMDLSILSSYVDMWKIRVKWHTKPHVFKRLGDKILKRYAAAFEISVEELKNFKG